MTGNQGLVATSLPQHTGNSTMLLNRDRANAIMDRENLDALVAVTSNNVYYLSGFESDFLYDVPWVACAILPRDPALDACLIVTEIEAAVLVQRPTWMPNVKLYYFGTYGGVLKVHTFADELADPEDIQLRQMIRQMGPNPLVGVADAAISALKELGLDKSKQIGIDDVRFLGALEGSISSENVIDATNLFIEIRMVKTPDEIKILREAAVKNQKSIEKAISAISAGVTWEEVHRAYEVSVAEQGARVFANFNGAGLNSAGAGRPNRAYPIKEGDQICFDSMLKWNRYMGDVQRTVVLGEPSKKMRDYWHAFECGIETAYESLKPGVETGKFREKTISSVRENGLPTFELAFTHGIGLDHIEVPFIAGGNLGDFPVEQNMVLNIDLELHEIGWGGMFFEETMLITAGGAERLYNLDRKLFVV
jgi:Xaa-Pro dipeptidase